jgi:beta-phosphoglucomutase-like phosphatase (HAD superfamily)
VSQTVDWLDQHGIPYLDLCFMKEKEQVGADIYIEDSPQNVEALRRGGHHVICFGNSTNTHVAAPRAAGWEEVYRLIHEYASRDEGLSRAIPAK